MLALPRRRRVTVRWRLMPDEFAAARRKSNRSRCYPLARVGLRCNSKPCARRPQYFFVNGRYFRDKCDARRSRSVCRRTARRFTPMYVCI